MLCQPDEVFRKTSWEFKLVEKEFMQIDVWWNMKQQPL